MKQKTQLRIMLYFTIAYLLLFIVNSIIKQNYEFLYYSLVMVVLIIAVVVFYKKLQLSTMIIGGLTLLGAMHIFGGNIYIGTTRLYDFWLIPGFFKYDNLVHGLGIFVATIIAYNLLHPNLDKKIHHNKIFLSLLLILIASGIGSFIEILELGGVILGIASDGVGDYMNNAVDLVFNLLGSIIACIIIMVKYHSENENNRQDTA